MRPDDSVPSVTDAAVLRLCRAQIPVIEISVLKNLTILQSQYLPLGQFHTALYPSCHILPKIQNLLSCRRMDQPHWLSLPLDRYRRTQPLREHSFRRLHFFHIFPVRTFCVGQRKSGIFFSTVIDLPVINAALDYRGWTAPPAFIRQNTQCTSIGQLHGQLTDDSQSISI